MVKKKTEENTIDNSSGPAVYSRDENGLLKNVQYTFNEDGSIDWRSMIKDEHLFPNRSWFEGRNKDCPRSSEGLADYQLLIKLGGIKELAKLRGFTDVYYETVKCEQDHVAIKCSMTFIPNYETGNEPIVFSDMANATLDNTSSFATKFLETIACNRAFVRCVRNFLGVHIVGADEIDKSDGESVKKSSSGDASHIFAITPTGTLQKTLAEVLNITNFDDFKEYLRTLWKNEAYKNEDIKDWNDFKDIPAKECRIIIALIRKTQK